MVICINCGHDAEDHYEVDDDLRGTLIICPDEVEGD